MEYQSRYILVYSGRTLIRPSSLAQEIFSWAEIREFSHAYIGIKALAFYYKILKDEIHSGREQKKWTLKLKEEKMVIALKNKMLNCVKLYKEANSRLRVRILYELILFPMLLSFGTLFLLLLYVKIIIYAF